MDILFVLWAVKVLTEAGAKALKIDGHYSGEEAWFKERVRRDRDPIEIYDFLKLLKSTGKVNLYACRLAVATVDVDETQLIPEANGIVDSVWFIDEKAVKADHCHYF